MIIINGFTIKIHKKNEAGFTLHLTGDDVPADGTLARFRVKKSPRYETVFVEKIVPIIDSSISIDLEEDDTEYLDSGNYVWNVAILYEGQNPWTLIEPAPKFIVLPEDGGS